MEGSGGNDEFVFCGACGTRLDAGVRFCTSCGASQAQFADNAEDESEQEGDAGTTRAATHEQAGGEEAASAPTEAMPAREVGGEGPPPTPPTGLGAGAQPEGGRGFREFVLAGAADAQPGGGRGGFLESLFDVKFDYLITPKLVRFFYVLSMIGLAIGTVAVIVAAFAASETTGVMFLFLAPLSALLYLIMIRLWLELIVVAFKIRDAVERVAENTERSDA